MADAAASMPAGAAGSKAPAGDLAGPIPFITVDEATNKFVVAPEAVDYLRGLNPKRRLAIVSIAGMYRTGKSYILNMMMGRPAGFEVGPTVRACTKGIWLWGGVISAKDMPQGDVAADVKPAPGSQAASSGGEEDTVDLLFMDTEGLGSTSRSETYDSRVFALALLLSSYFVYNSVGTIDGSAISKLSLVVNLTKHIHVRSHSRDADTGSEFGQFFPQFLWVVRDFGVRLERDGRRISARDYLEDALKPEPGVSDGADTKNSVRLLLRSFFPERDCVTMVRPVTDEAKLAGLAAEPWDALRPEFRAQVDALRRRVFTGARPKTLFGQPVSGAMLVELAAAYTGAMNENRAPTISTAWERVVDSRCAEAAEAALREYDASFRELSTARAKADAAAEAAGAAEGGGGAAASAGAAATAAGGEGAAADDAAAAAVAGARARISALREGPGPGAAALRADVLSSAALLEVADEALARATARFRRDAVKDDARAEPFAGRVAAGAAERRRELVAANEAASARACAAVAAAAWEAAAEAVPALTSAASSATAAAAAEGAAAGGDGGGAGGGGGGGGATHATASRVVDAARRRLAAFEAAYRACAVGPARERVWGGWVLGRPLEAAAADADVADGAARRALQAARSEAEAVRLEKLEAEGRLRVAEEAARSERARLQAALESAAAEGATKQEALRSQLEAASDERRRVEARAERARAAAEEEAAARRDELKEARAAETAARTALSTAQAGLLARLEAKLDSSAELAEARGRIATLTKLAADARVSEEAAEKRAAVAEERAAAATDRAASLARETELLRESVEVKQHLIDAREAEKEEVEYQWGVSKAENASLESEKLELQTAVAGWKGLCGQLKVALGRRGPPSGLDEIERRLYASV
ncbi:hypothetical protein FNF29_04358 [Cafeteria roenbergensis]|uniref:GB1/RHD3-type G domain-containing protein n=1 Tax=Cafeteria roenbergensis TaxID=33653 RepID=A0A5A8CF91_CAFRO|nr:hypothetical protein FNF29_04358 [Cafeteria roenbergensis]|eukprot:KAA0151672.1 hypothetical protein FNF29_04358 [Cafeteria roenbergensis]